MARAAFSVRSGEETRQVQMVCLDDLVPADDDLRRIERLVDWDQVRRTAEPFYRPGGAGRPGMDPAVLVKLALVLAWRGLPSMRADVAGRRDRCVDPAVSRVRAHRAAAGSLDVQSRADQALRGLLGVRAAVHGGAAPVHRGGPGRRAAAAGRRHAHRGRRGAEEPARRAVARRDRDATTATTRRRRRRRDGR